MPRHAAIAQITGEMLSRMLGLREGIRIRSVRDNPFRDVFEILLEGTELPEAPEATEPMRVDLLEYRDTMPVIRVIEGRDSEDHADHDERYQAVLESLRTDDRE